MTHDLKLEDWAKQQRADMYASQSTESALTVNLIRSPVGSLTRSTDPVLSKFDQDEISVVSHMLDFLYDKSILSADNHLRNMELHYVIGVGGVRDIPHQTWVVSKALERLNTIVSSTGDMHSDHVPPVVLMGDCNDT